MIHQCGMHTRNRTLLLMHTACSECYENTLNTRRASGIQDPPTGQVYCPTCGRNVPSAQTPTSMMLEPVKYARVMLGDDTRLTFIEAVDGDGSNDTGPDDDTTDNFGVAVVPDVGLAAAPDVDMAVVSQQHPPGNTSPTVEQLMAMMNQLNCRQQEADAQRALEAEHQRREAEAQRVQEVERQRREADAQRAADHQAFREELARRDELHAEGIRNMMLQQQQREQQTRPPPAPAPPPPPHRQSESELSQMIEQGAQDEADEAVLPYLMRNHALRSLRAKYSVTTPIASMPTEATTRHFGNDNPLYWNDDTDLAAARRLNDFGG